MDIGARPTIRRPKSTQAPCLSPGSGRRPFPPEWPCVWRGTCGGPVSRNRPAALQQWPLTRPKPSECDHSILTSQRPRPRPAEHRPALPPTSRPIRTRATPRPRRPGHASLRSHAATGGNCGGRITSQGTLAHWEGGAFKVTLRSFQKDVGVSIGRPHMVD